MTARRRPEKVLVASARGVVDAWAARLTTEARALLSQHDLAALAEQMGWWVVNGDGEIVAGLHGLPKKESTDDF